MFSQRKKHLSRLVASLRGHNRDPIIPLTVMAILHWLNPNDDPNEGTPNAECDLALWRLEPSVSLSHHPFPHVLLVCCESGHERMVASLLQCQGTNSQFISQQCWSQCVCKAAKCGHDRIIRMMYEFKLSAQGFQQTESEETKDDDEERSALHLAAKAGHELCVSTILEFDAEQARSLTRKHNVSALASAAHHGHLGCLKLLLRAAPEMITNVERNGDTALHWAASKGHVDCVRVLLAADPSCARIVTKDGITALHKAASGGHESYGALLDADPSLIRCVTNTKKTALHFAAMKGFEKCAQTLLERDPTIVDMRDDEGKNALHHACSYGSVECVRFILDMEPTLITSVDHHGCSALHWAVGMETEVIRDHDKCIQLLLSKRPQLMQIVDDNGTTAVHYASYHGNVSVLRSLLFEYDPTVITSVDDSRRNVFHYATLRGYAENLTELVKYAEKDSQTLLSALQAVDDQGMTPLRYSYGVKNKECSRILLAYTTE